MAITKGAHLVSGLPKKMQGTLHKACSMLDDMDGDPAYIDCLIALFFLKCVDQSGESAVAAIPVQVPAESYFDFLFDRGAEPGNASRLAAALHALEEANLSLFTDMFSGILPGIARLASNPVSDRAVRHLMTSMAQLSFVRDDAAAHQSNLAGSAFRFLIERIGNASTAWGEGTVAPEGVAALVAALADLQSGESICDPFCGTGSLLLSAALHAKARVASAKCALFGQERNQTAWSLAKINLYLNGILNHRVVLGDALLSPQLLQGPNQLKHFDVAVSMPPMAQNDWGFDALQDDLFGRFVFGLPPKTKGDFAAIQHMLASLNPNHGRMLVVTTLGVLFRGGSDGEIRQRLIEANLLDTVIVLPDRLLSNTGVPLAILIFRREKTDDNVLFVDASKEFQSGRKQNALTPENINTITSLCEKRESNGETSHLATSQEIASNGFNCSIQRYVRPQAKELVIDINELLREERVLNQQIDELSASIEESLQQLGYVIATEEKA